MSIELHNAFDLRRRTWTGRRAHRAWLVRAGRLICLIVFVVLTTCIVLYVRLTNPDRVRALAEAFFTDYVDAKISIQSARLSLMDGLQLDGVTISNREGGDHATVVKAKRLQLSYSPLALLAGRIESAQILAIEPEIFLVENVATGLWNLQALQKPPTTAPTTMPADEMGGLPPLPEVLIRGGSVHRAQVDGRRFRTLQTIRLEGQFLPSNDDSYSFNLQSRTAQGAAGPAFQGRFTPANLSAESSLTNVELTFLEPLLPAKVRSFWRMLEPSGRVDVPILRINRGGSEQVDFHIELALDDVHMRVHPTDWASASERAVLNAPQKTIAVLNRLPLDTSLLSAAVELQPKLRTGSVPMDDVSGRFVFTEEGVTIDGLQATIDGNAFEFSGSLGGYSVEEPLQLTLNSPAGQPVELKASIPYMDALPAEIREVYYRFAPRGKSNLRVTLSRQVTSGPLEVAGAIEFDNADFVFQEFRYPVRNASGRLVVDADPKTREPRLVIDKIRGNGPVDGPNASGELFVDGVIAPLIGHAAVDVTVSGKDVHSEPALIAALPVEARNVIDEFDDDGPGPNPVFSGDFTCRVIRQPGAISRWSYDTDISVRNGRGAFKAFPYPLEDLAVDLLIRKDNVQILSAKSAHAGGTIEISGMSEWGTRVTGDKPRRIGDPNLRTVLTLKARDIPINDALRNALPANVRATLDRFGLGGVINVTGPITVSDPRADPEFDFMLQARDATFAPTDWKTHVNQIAATMQITPRLVRIDRAVGLRGEAKVGVSGLIDMTDREKPSIALDAFAVGMDFDSTLRDSLPEPARPVWDSLRPSGTADASLKLTGDPESPTWALDITPRGNAKLDKPDFLPIPIVGLNGKIQAVADRVEMKHLSGELAGGTATLDGVGEFAGRTSWALKLSTQDTLLDPVITEALPAAMRDLLKENEVAGRADLQFRRLDWTTAADGKSSDIIFDAAATLRDFSWRTGVGFDKVDGTVVLRGHFIDDEPADLNGDAAFRTFRIAEIDAREGAGKIATDGKRVLIKDLRAAIGEGEVAGDVTLDRSRPDQTRWSANFLMRNADVGALTAASPTKMNGTLNASLAIEGAWNTQAGGLQPLARRGRGDIAVSGKDMLDVPMILGVTQIVSLKLPFTSGFNQATASYSLNGDRVSFSDIDLQSTEMHIKGAGWLDFDKKQVNLDFYTDSAGKKLPVIGHLLDAARRELFQIKVRGTLQEPQVKAGSLRTITTTVDEILNNEKR